MQAIEISFLIEMSIHPSFEDSMYRGLLRLVKMCLKYEDNIDVKEVNLVLVMEVIHHTMNVTTCAHIKL